MVQVGYNSKNNSTSAFLEFGGVGTFIILIQKYYNFDDKIPV